MELRESMEPGPRTEENSREFVVCCMWVKMLLFCRGLYVWKGLVIFQFAFVNLNGFGILDGNDI